MSNDKSPSSQKFNKPTNAGVAKRAFVLDKFTTAYNLQHKGSKTHNAFTKPGSMNQGKR